MPIEYFCNKWNISSEAIYNFKNEKAFYYPLNSKIKYVDEKFFIRRREFSNRVREYNQTMAYYLEEHFSISHISQNIKFMYPNIHAGSVDNFLRVRLFMLDDRTIVTSKISKIEWAIFRYFRAIHRRIEKSVGFKINPDKILDTRMMNAA